MNAHLAITKGDTSLQGKDLCLEQVVSKGDGKQVFYQKLIKAYEADWTTAKKAGISITMTDTTRRRAMEKLHHCISRLDHKRHSLLGTEGIPCLRLVLRYIAFMVCLTYQEQP
ncbi:hypothetical protein ACFQY3_24835 [Paenibacillus farraposensis]|uniref:hypothetical protein n=1 Tax=Paenibacillus farraposensis TaxID=2807095 RepID=UPI003615A61A